MVIWKWDPDYDTAVKRRRRKTKYEDVIRGYLESGAHPAMCLFDSSGFESAIEKQFGTIENGEPFLIERTEMSLCISMAYSQVPELVQPIGLLARRFGLTSAGE